MISHPLRGLRRWSPVASALAATFAAACSSSPPPQAPSENLPVGSDDSGSGDGDAACTPGSPTPGPADTHCTGMVQPTSEASCHVDAGGDAGADDGCAYGDTMFGHEGDDDDCKYHVVWSATPICENTNVLFTVTVTNLDDGSPATGSVGGLMVEPFIPVSTDASCDDKALPGAPISPSIGSYIPETPAGSGIYQGPVLFNGPGEWTVRFHIHEECADLLPDSPHGHAAFHIDVP